MPGGFRRARAGETGGHQFARRAPAPALEAYSADQKQQFISWCTGAKSATESTCSCTVKRLAQTVAPAARAQFIASQTGGGGFNLSASAATTTALVAEALVGCSK